MGYAVYCWVWRNLQPLLSQCFTRGYDCTAAPVVSLRVSPVATTAPQPLAAPQPNIWLSLMHVQHLTNISAIGNAVFSVSEQVCVCRLSANATDHVCTAAVWVKHDS